MSPWKRRLVIASALALLGLVIALWWATTDERAEPSPAAPQHAPASRTDPTATATPAPTSSAPAAIPSQPLAPTNGDAAPKPVGDTIDPCTEVVEPEVPAGFDTRSIANITLAWHREPSDEPIHVEPLARLAQGIAEEAATATGTPPRAHLTIILYSSPRELQERTRAPAWAGGAYNGAVNVPSDIHHELSVDVATLRHEIMHAQLHDAIGCMPSWFDEGIATYFAEESHLNAMALLLHNRDFLDAERMEKLDVENATTREPGKHYAQSLTMVMYALAHRDHALDVLVAHYRASPEAGRVHIWQNWFPDAGPDQLAEFLAQRVFGAALGPDLDAVLRNPCCSHGRDIDHLSCRACKH
jgi:hypothetical protein